MDALIEEVQKLKARNFELHFNYPTKEEREELMIVHRDMTRDDISLVDSRTAGVAGLIEDLESGRIHPEDFDEDMLARLEALIRRRP